MHISPFEQGNRFNQDPTRTRKLLLHKEEINKLIGLTKQKGFTLVPLDLHLRNGYAKIQLALAKGKKLHDKRETAAKRDADREIRRQLKQRVWDHFYRMKLPAGFLARKPFTSNRVRVIIDDVDASEPYAGAFMGFDGDSSSVGSEPWGCVLR